jgi:hypothetical protein
VGVQAAAGTVENPRGISSSARNGSVGFLSRGEGGWEVRRRMEGNTLSRELAELGATLSLDEDARAVLPVPGLTDEESAPLALLTLALLYHGVRCEVVGPSEVEAVAREVAPTLVALSRECRDVLSAAEGLASIGTVRRVVSLCPATTDSALAPLNRDGSRVVRLGWDAISGTAAAHLVRADEEEPGTAVARRAGEELVRIGAATEARPHLFGSVPVLSTRLLRNGRGGGRVLVVPDLEGVEDLQELRQRLLSDIGRYNAAVELSGRVAAVGISLIPRETLALRAGGEGESEGDAGVLWLPTRRRGEDDADPEQLLRESVLLFGALFDAVELEFFVAPPPHGAAHAGAAPDLGADPPARRARRRPTRPGIPPEPRPGVGAAPQPGEPRCARRRRRRASRPRLGASEDPEGKLLPEPVSALVRAGIGGAISTFFRYGMRTSGARRRLRSRRARTSWWSPTTAATSTRGWCSTPSARGGAGSTPSPPRTTSSRHPVGASSPTTSPG